MSETPAGTPSTPDPGMSAYQSYAAIPGDTDAPVPVSGVPAELNPNGFPQAVNAMLRGWICPVCAHQNHLVMPACGQCGLEATVLVVPTEALRRLRKYWEHGVNEGMEDMSIQDWQRALRDVFDGKDGALTLVDRALGPTGWV